MSEHPGKSQAQSSTLPHPAPEPCEGSPQRLRLIPRDSTFFPLYCAQAGLAAKAAAVLEADLHDFTDPAGAADGIRDLLRQGGQIRHEITSRLDHTFVPPFGSGDALDLAAALHGLLDAISRVADQLVIYRLTQPPRGAVAQMKLLRQVCEVLVEAVASLDRPSELRGFPPRIESIRSQAHESYRRHIRHLFADGRNARRVLTGKDIYRGIEEAVEQADSAGRVLDRIALGAPPLVR